MKKMNDTIWRLLIIYDLILVLLLTGIINVGCATDETVDEVKPEKIKYADMIPDPKEYFTSDDIQIIDPDGGTAYILFLSVFSNDERLAYIEAVKEAGFDNIRYETKENFGAYTEDGKYWFQINMDSETELYIFCQTSENYGTIE